MHLIQKEINEFSCHEKIEKSDIFFSFCIDNVKPMKRGRVPKGFLSSNTAYMLVYKKLTTDCQINTMKKMKLKKPDAEANVSDESVYLERLTVKDKSDILDETKQKDNIENEPLFQEESPEKILNLESENEMEMDKTVVSQKTDMLTMDKTETVETVVNANGCKDKFNSVSQQMQNKVECLKQPVIKVVKLDYKLLNGAAHRAMSCGERDFYEEVTFLKIF